MKLPVQAIAVLLSILLFIGSAQAGTKDTKFKLISIGTSRTGWKCRKLASYSSRDFFKASSLHFWGRSFAPSIVKKVIPKNSTIMLIELKAAVNGAGPTNGPGYASRYNIAIVTGDVPETEYFWARHFGGIYGDGLGYIAFKGASPRFVDAKRMSSQIPYFADIDKTYNEVKDYTLWIRIVPLTGKLYEADPPTAKEKRAKATESHWLRSGARRAAKSKARQHKNQSQSRDNSSSAGKTAIKPLPSSLSPGDVITNSIGMKLVLIPPGDFVMGALATHFWGLDSERPPHRVRISRGFRMGAHEVTQAQWKAVMGTNPSSFKGDELPVHGVPKWNGADTFCYKLSKMEGKHYRLPTEAEWEYACKAGTTTVFYTDNNWITTDQVNFKGSGEKDTYRKKPLPVGSFSPNAWGLYDMYGNVYEWCQDWYATDYYSKSPTVDPMNSTVSGLSVIRGGYWGSDSSGCRSAVRGGQSPNSTSKYYGFRVVLDLE